MATGVTRHLNYAWIEFGHSADGQQFCSGLDRLGWKNLVRYLPRKEDEKGAHYESSAHATLPIRWKGGARLILPNSVVDNHHYPKDYVDDPLFKAHRDAHGEDAFRTEMERICSFLSRWVFSPGIKGSPTSTGELTLGDGAVDWADLVACSGHGSSGVVWGGDYQLGCKLAAELKASAGASGSDRLKYVLIPTCYNLSEWGRDLWLPALRRSGPVHGVLGYSQAYPGGPVGGDAFQRFAANMKKNGGTTPILEAFKAAHGTGWLSERWGALIHASAMNDTMRTWLKGELPAPSPSGEIRWFCKDNWPEGEVVTPTVPPYSAHYVIGGQRLDVDNHLRLDVGLFPGENGEIEIKKTSGTFSPTDSIEVIFYYYRPEKDGMDLDKLLSVGTTPDAEVTVTADLNKRDGSTNKDGLTIRPLKPGLSRIAVPFTVIPTAHNNYSADGADGFGYFWLRLRVGSSEYSHYTDGAWLRKPRG